MSLTGVCAATLTPLHADLTPNTQAYVEHCRTLLSNGCDALNLLGTTGEAMSLSLQQRLDIIDAVAASDLPHHVMMVGTGASAFTDAVELTRRVANAGFGGALLMPPFYYKNVGDDGIVRFFDELTERIADNDLRIYLYHFPAMSGIAFTLPLIERLVERFPKAIIGLKDSSNVPGYAESIVQAFPYLAIFPSSETILRDARKRGFAGCISATVNVAPALAAAVWRNADDSVGEHQAQLTTIRETITRFPLIPALRYLTSRANNDPTWLRMLPPLTPLATSQTIELDEALKATHSALV